MLIGMCALVAAGCQNGLDIGVHNRCDVPLGISASDAGNVYPQPVVIESAQRMYVGTASGTAEDIYIEARQPGGEKTVVVQFPVDELRPPTPDAPYAEASGHPTASEIELEIVLQGSTCDQIKAGL